MTEHPLTLDDREEVGARIDAIGLHLSEFSFPNLYLFRKTHSYSVVTTDHGLFVSGLTYDKKGYLMPMMRPDLADEVCFEELKELLRTGRWDFVFPVPEEWDGCFSNDEFVKTSNENDSDYLFFTEKMKTYPGKKMHKKKNLLNQFLRAHQPRMTPLTPEVREDALTILDIWQEASPQELDTSDYFQTKEALELHDELALVGAMYYADGKPMGFIIAEPLNEETFTIHFAKADIRFKGSYQYMFSAFAKEYCPNYLYINLEQDMGKEGLRKTKLSYRPDLMARKFRVSLKK